jgi:hypothetical protein
MIKRISSKQCKELRSKEFNDVGVAVANEKEAKRKN